ncbi:hypothetical protein AGLY_011415 [Aphis glycines]|uniref:Uncharacterized protein n=1 Tax=Aphis glycines TaxID=307491 RepID=A0A6G0TDD1_APHGL|nr:hypothetical protein AGLY_011415 [Aphis glycines]
MISIEYIRHKRAAITSNNTYQIVIRLGEENNIYKIQLKLKKVGKWVTLCCTLGDGVDLGLGKTYGKLSVEFFNIPLTLTFGENFNHEPLAMEKGEGLSPLFSYRFSATGCHHLLKNSQIFNWLFKLINMIFRSQDSIQLYISIVWLIIILARSPKGLGLLISNAFIKRAVYSQAVAIPFLQYYVYIYIYIVKKKHSSTQQIHRIVDKIVLSFENKNVYPNKASEPSQITTVLTKKILASRSLDSRSILTKLNFSHISRYKG